MSNENSNTIELLHRKFKCLFPKLKNPYAYQLQEITELQWIDTECLWLYEKDYQQSPSVLP